MTYEFMAAVILVTQCGDGAMVHCVIVGCFNKSGRRSSISFYRIPKVIFGRSPREELSRKRREGFLAAISRAASDGQQAGGWQNLF